MIDFIVPLMLGGLASVWRFFDGSDRRPSNSNLYTFALVLLAGLWSVQSVYDPASSLLVLLPDLLAYCLCILVTGWLMVRGLPGWDRWGPHAYHKGHKCYTLTFLQDTPRWHFWRWRLRQSSYWREGMLLGFALPTALAALLYGSHNQLSAGLIYFALSGSLVTVVYVQGSKLEARLLTVSSALPFFTAEEWGRLSYGFMIAGLASL